MNPKLKSVFKDVDGTAYFANAAGDIVDKRGALVSLQKESNVRAFLRGTHCPACGRKRYSPNREGCPLCWPTFATQPA